MPVAPLASVQTFTNNNASVQGIKQSPVIQSRLLQKQAMPSALAPDNNSGARVQALQNEADKIGAWSSRMTGYKQQDRLRREAQSAVQASQSSVKTTPSAGGAIANVINGEGPAASNVSLPSASGTGIRAQIIRNAQAMTGTPYAWGGGGIGNRGSRGTGKGTQGVIGVDCSGLTSYVYGLVGYKLPRFSGAQTASGVKTSIANAQPGDLVGWGPGGHVAIYAGNGMIIESPKPGGHVQTRKLHARDTARGVYAVRLRLPGE